MRLTLNSTGKAKLKPDEIKTSITIGVADKEDRNRCISNLINTIGTLTENLNKKEYIKEVDFDSYNIREQKKSIKYKKEDKEYTEYVFDFWSGESYLHFNMPLDFAYVEEVQKICDSLYKDEDNYGIIVASDFNYGLSEQSENDIQTLAINSALDKMKEQAEKIKSHLNLKNAELKEINFIENSTIRGNAFMSKSKAMYDASLAEKEFSISELDKILNLKDITKYITVTSEWEIK